MKIRTIIFYSLSFGSASCNQRQYTNIKNGILYKDESNNIYIRKEINILDRADSKRLKEIRYFDDASYYDSVVKLKDFIDIKTFQRLRANEFEDKNFKYIFKDIPAIFPNLKYVSIQY